jgi:hypothetical protein
MYVGRNYLSINIFVKNVGRSRWESIKWKPGVLNNVTRNICSHSIRMASNGCINGMDNDCKYVNEFIEVKEWKLG